MPKTNHSASDFSRNISEQIKPATFETFKTDTYFRLKTSLSWQRTNFGGQELITVFGSGNVFQIQNYERFQA